MTLPLFVNRNVSVYTSCICMYVMHWYIRHAYVYIHISMLVYMENLLGSLYKTLITTVSSGDAPWDEGS